MFNIHFFKYIFIYIIIQNYINNIIYNILLIDKFIKKFCYERRKMKNKKLIMSFIFYIMFDLSVSAVSAEDLQSNDDTGSFTDLSNLISGKTTVTLEKNILIILILIKV